MARTAPEIVSSLVLVGRLLLNVIQARSKVTVRPLPYPRLYVRIDDPEIDSARQVTAPTLVVWGRRDLYFPPRYATRAAELLPDAAVHIFDRLGHAPHIEAPDQFATRALEFWQTLPNS